MCHCKLHLHFQWAVEALLQWAKKVEIEIPDTTTYRHLLSKLMVDCPAEQHTHVSWACTPNRKHICDDLTKNWNNMKELLFAADDGTICVPFKEFQSQLVYNGKGEVVKNKAGKEVKKLVAVSHHVSLEYIVTFIQKLLPNIVHHRNHLRLFRNTKKMFMDLFLCIYMDVDFSGKPHHWYQVGAAIHALAQETGHHSFWDRQNTRWTENIPPICFRLQRPRSTVR